MTVAGIGDAAAAITDRGYGLQTVIPPTILPTRFSVMSTEVETSLDILLVQIAPRAQKKV